MNAGLAALSLLIALYGAMAVRLGRAWISMPMVFVAGGLLLGSGATGLLPLSPEAAGVRQLTEITLVLVLFADASTLRLRDLRSDAGLPVRLLAIALPLTMVFGAALALAFVPQLGLPVAALLGTILAPTDAALGLPIFSNPQIPVRIRRALNVESGLNDGIAAPFVTLFISLALAGAQPADHGWLEEALLEIGLGVVVGGAVGVLGGWLFNQTARRGWTIALTEQLGILGLALGAYFGAASVHGNGFVAAFIGGLAFSAMTRNGFGESTEFTENTGSLLSVLVWTLFGSVLVGPLFQQFEGWRPIVYALLSLTLVRMLSVAVSLLGTGLRRDTVALMGWFGPRGLASVVFTLLVYDRFTAAGQSSSAFLIVATWTILLSVLLHGLTAPPLAAWYARRLRAASAGAQPLAELVEVPESHRRRHVLPPVPEWTAPAPAGGR